MDDALVEYLEENLSPEVGGSTSLDAVEALKDGVHDPVKKPDVYKSHFVGKTIVIVFDNGPDFTKTQDKVQGREDLELLRVGPYSPMCNPIEVALPL
ncbi:hypothetical protein PPTG_22905 [Phytophthora nicotianae INRA-310]|uniref:Tc1-like transposase DDE domain-containing protein n=1 Tax=Phytophthora nicotianae (strain INRA-310) TaxID=761204 RepID=W2Q728_PHYN3|nr:hypothetical protein PPTG_22905 [Phytophthora nicotianae INRA-310]ETN08962.1 hypothetical protein PPTG_22905 [Phytophthora nicotianae INRA-310]